MLEGSEIVVPGSISNLGPGFDTISVAVDLYLRVRIVELRPSLPDTFNAAFIPAPPHGEDRIATAFHRARARAGMPAPGLRVEVRSDIPARAGLGSSGAATVAGLRLYEAVTARRGAAEWLTIASEIEGHPDNAAASLLGGLVLSCQRDNGSVTARVLQWPPSIRFVVATPDVPLETAHARRVLPSRIPLRDAVFNLQHALLLLDALERGRPEDLREALRDRWHQPFRATLVPGLAEALALDHPALLGICISGAGPSIVALTTDRVGEAVTIIEGLYRRLRVPCTIRVLSAHQSDGVRLKPDPADEVRPEPDATGPVPGTEVGGTRSG